MNYMVWLWLGAIVLFGVVEALTAGLVSIWFVAGSSAALIGALLGVACGYAYGRRHPKVAGGKGGN